MREVPGSISGAAPNMPLPVFYQLKGVRVHIRARPAAGLAEANALPGLVVFSSFRCERSQVRFPVRIRTWPAAGIDDGDALLFSQHTADKCFYGCLV